MDKSMIKNDQKWEKLNELTLEANMLLIFLNDALRTHEFKHGTCSIICLSEAISKKFFQIRELF